MSRLSIYIHIPFCKHRCAYCDFNTYAGIEEAIPAYVDALCHEIEYIAQYDRGLNVHTVYFGGGTPSLLSPEEFERLLTTLSKKFTIVDDLEVTIEANPGTLSLGYLSDIHNTGVNRLSLGMQSAKKFELSLLEREHDFIDVINALLWAREAGFDNINLDLIYGLPNQSDGDWQSSLTSALGLTPEHISMYALGLEEGTLMHRWVKRGLLSAPDPDLAAEMYEWGGNALAEAGYYPYELSSWAKQNDLDVNGFECRHNLQYWRNQPYLGIGAGAHGFAGGLRVANVMSPFDYINRLAESKAKGADFDNPAFPRTPATSHVDLINEHIEMGETMMMGLRLLGEGVSAQKFKRRFNRSIEDVFEDRIEQLLEKGLIEWDSTDGKTLRLSQRGRLLGNLVFVEFV